MAKRALIAALFLTLIYGAFIGRLFHLQVIRGQEYANQIESARTNYQLIPAQRGRILDRHGQILVDNRHSYHVAVRLQDLCFNRRKARSWPFRSLNPEQFDAFLVDCAELLQADPYALRSTVEQHFRQHPGVAIRRSGARFQEIGLVALPQNAVNEINPHLIDLAQRGILQRDIRLCLLEEMKLRWDLECWLFSPEEYQAFCRATDNKLEARDGFSREVFGAYVQELFLEIPSSDDKETHIPQRFILLLPQKREQAESTIGLLRSIDVAQVHNIINRFWQRLAQLPQEIDKPYLVAPHYLSLELITTTRESTVQEINISGAPRVEDIIYYIQEDGENGGMLSGLAYRLANTLGDGEEWLPALMRQHSEQVRAITIINRYSPMNLLVLDPDKVNTYCSTVSAYLRGAGREISPSEIEHQLYKARRRADRAQAGSTAYDAIPVVTHISKDLVQALSPLMSQVPNFLAKNYDDISNGLPGLAIATDVGREYRHPTLAVHVLGSLGKLNARNDYDRHQIRAAGLDPDGWGGISGIERSYDDILQGIAGIKRTYLNPEGVADNITINKPQSGQDLYTTIDITLQRVAQNSLVNWFKLAEENKLVTEKMRKGRDIGRNRAGFVLMDVHDGSILAMASNPAVTRDQMRFNYEELSKDKSQPLIDHSSSASNPPGSCMKILTGMAAYAEGKTYIGEQIYSAGQIGSMGDHAPAGTYDMAKAIQMSSNVVFAKLGLRLGPEKLSEWFMRFGCGRSLPGNQINWQQIYRGITPENIAWTRKLEPHWNIGDTRRLAIGNFWASSPLEIITIPAAVANGGQIVLPHVVHLEERNYLIDTIPLSTTQMNEIRRGMELVTDPNEYGGTARALLLTGGQKVAAKTGTSEWGSRASRAAGKNPDHAWLIGYAPAENPQVCFASFVHSGTSGGRANTGIVKKVLETYFELYPDGHR